MRTSLLTLLVLIAASPGAHAGAPPLAADVSKLSNENLNADGTQIESGAIKATASTTLCETKPAQCHGPELLLDDDIKTAWCEGLPGRGEGATLTFTFDTPKSLDSIFIMPHYASSLALAQKNARLAAIDITTDAGTVSVELDDLVSYAMKHVKAKVKRSSTTDCDSFDCMSRDDFITGIGQSISLGYKGVGGAFQAAPITTRKVVITVRKTYAGTKFQDTCASDILFFHAQGSP